MALNSYYDLGASPTPTDVQSAAADAYQRQEAEHLAVLPAVNLRGAFQNALARQRGQQQLALGTKQVELGQQRLDMATAQDAYERRMMPWTIAAGAASGALGVYGGYRAQQQQELRAAESARQMALLSEIRAQNDRATTGYVAHAAKLRDVLAGQGYDTRPATYAAPY